MIAAVATLIAGLLFARGLRATFSDTERLGRLRTPAGGDVVRVSGVLRTAEGAAAPACAVLSQRWESCGKNRCWVTRGEMTIADATLETTGGERYRLTAGFEISPVDPGNESRGHAVSMDRATELRGRAKEAGVFGFQDGPRDWRILERCLHDGESVFAIACRTDGPEGSSLGRCPDDEPWALVLGDGTPQAALDEAADYVLYWYAAAMLAVFFALLLVWPRPHKLAELLAIRAGKPPRGFGWAFSALSVPGALAFLNLMWRNGTPVTSTWSSGRGAYALASLAGALLFILGAAAARRRSILRDAVRPIESTPRSPLASAMGSTVELSVTAAAEPTHRSYVASEPVAYSSITVRETYSMGKSSGTRDLVLGKSPSKELRVEDESGDGVLQLDEALLDVEVHETRMKDADRRLEELVGELERHEAHQHYLVTEEIVKPGEPLYVLGEVVSVSMHASEGAYRSVRGSPTLAGSGAPLLVYSGTERGLLEEMRAEERGLGLVFQLAACAAIVLAVIVVGLAAL
jgi:hypothetical protein